MKYLSTRGASPVATFETTLLSALAPDGGLYVPENWAALKGGKASLSYVQIAEEVMAPYVVSDLISRDDLRRILEGTYGPAAGVFRNLNITPVETAGKGLCFLNLYEGPTLAFKDVALQVLGRLFDHVLGKTGEHLTIIGATSGDTGSAAIEACKDRKNITVFILHPEGRTSDIQRRQMTTVLSENVHNIAIQGTFDDCQALVKKCFQDPDIAGRLKLSAINSINWARIIAQTVYYVTTARRLAAAGRVSPVFAVPTGNFGNVYAGYVAKKMGADIGTLVLGSNRNDILTRFFETGIMEVHSVVPSLSPSMDIQVSSNFERFLFDLLGRDAGKLALMMQEFRETGKMAVTLDLLGDARNEFLAASCSDEETLATIRTIYEGTGLVIDPHTAVGVHAAGKLKAQGKLDADRPVVALACAHPCKFPDTIEKAIGIRPALPSFLADLLDRPEKLTVLGNDYDMVKARILRNSGIAK
jgi:threonine synthase